jgi:hypothetical protein
MPKYTLPQLESASEAVLKAWDAETAFWGNNKHGEEKRSPMFTFAQHLRGEPAFRKKDAYEALELVRAAMESQDFSSWGESINCDDPEAAFVKMWDTVVLPATFDTALRLAQLHPVKMENFVSKPFSAFISLCAHLQRLSGNAPIIIASPHWGQELGVSARTICTQRDVAVAMGLLKLVSEGDYEEGKAARYFYIGPFNYR